MKSRPDMSRQVHISILLSILLGSLLLTSCASRQLTEYNQGLRRVHNLTDDELRRVQFYNSNTIVLTLADEVREAPNPKRRKQKLDIRHIDQIIIEEHTRGLAVAVGGNWMDISFEEGKALHRPALPRGLPGSPPQPVSRNPVGSPGPGTQDRRQAQEGQRPQAALIPGRQVASENSPPVKRYQE
jgi:hypothetical protein